MKTVLTLVIIALLAMSARAQANQTEQRGRSFKGRLAIQLWSFRHDFEKDVPATLRRVRALGFTRVELAGYYGLTAQQFKAELARAGLTAVSMHVGFDEIQNKLDEIIRDARLFGVKQVGVPWINSPFTQAECPAPQNGESGCPLWPPGIWIMPSASWPGETTMRSLAPKSGDCTRGIFISPSS